MKEDSLVDEKGRCEVSRSARLAHVVTGYNPSTIASLILVQLQDSPHSDRANNVRQVLALELQGFRKGVVHLSLGLESPQMYIQNGHQAIHETHVSPRIAYTPSIPCLYTNGSGKLASNHLAKHRL